jgi:signal transduction histidine kinase
MKKYAIIARVFAGATLFTAWGLTNQPLTGVPLVLALTALSAIRYRFAAYRWLIPAEILMCGLFAVFWTPALLGLWFPAIGLLEGRWHSREEELLGSDSHNRSKRFELERERESAATRAANAARIAEISERARIAQDIHDHAGHEITGALIALQTAANLAESNAVQSAELLNRAITRLESASVTLRETVHNLRPAKVESGLEEICRSFDFCEIDCSQIAEPSVHGEVFAANLKEALTNITRHGIESGATEVRVRVDENADYIRMIIADNGRPPDSYKLGMGISGMKDRVRRLGGTLTISTDAGFKVTQVIPKGGYS